MKTASGMYECCWAIHMEIPILKPKFKFTTLGCLEVIGMLVSIVCFLFRDHVLVALTWSQRVASCLCIVKE
jgi:hypothetical protein